MSNDELMLEELGKIRELLTPKPAPLAPPAPKGFKNEFKAFLEKYKVFGMAIAFIMGLYVKEVIQAIVDDIIMPIIGLAIPGDLGWEEWVVAGFRLGHFFGTVLTFLIVAFVIFWLVKLLKKWGIK